MGLLLLVAFLVVPLVELSVIVQVGQGIGVLPTVLLLLAVSVVGAALVRHEGARAWRRFTNTVQVGQIPTQEVVDGALLLLGGALMLTPGFITDAVGLLLVVPLSRGLVNRFLRRRVRARFGLTSPGRPPRGPAGHPKDIVEVEVVDVRREPPSRPDELRDGAP